MQKATLKRILAASCLLAAACGGGDPRGSEGTADRQAVQTALEAYLPLLAQAYATGELAPLQPYAAQKEVASVQKRVTDLAVQGRTLEATLRSVTVEDVRIWNYSNAYVTTHEVWDLVVYATGTDQVLASEYEQPNRVKYQLKRDGDSWRILFREIQE
jgi:hypothetical protein